MGKKEEITDMMSAKSYYARDDNGEYMFHKGKVLKFKMEDKVTSIKITRIDRKNMRMWGEHIELHSREVVYGHRQHNVDATEETTKQYGSPFCTDCEVPVTEPATMDGDIKATERRDRTLSDGTPIE